MYLLAFVCNKIKETLIKTSTSIEPVFHEVKDTATTMNMADNASNSGSSSNHNCKLGASFNEDSSSAHLSSNASSTTNTSHTGTSRTKGTGIPEAILAWKETRAVHYSRIMVLSVLVISAAVVGGLTFWLSSESERDNFAVQVKTSISFYNI
jgi:hypothetical protein